MILALDLYFRLPPNSTSKGNPLIIELSDILNRLPIHPDRADAERFRNPNGVYMKLCNFLRFDPSYAGVGLKAGPHHEEEIWNEFAIEEAPEGTVLCRRLGIFFDGNGEIEPLMAALMTICFMGPRWAFVTSVAAFDGVLAPGVALFSESANLLYGPVRATTCVCNARRLQPNRLLIEGL